MRQNHILSEETIFRIAHELRKQGKIVGFTHGAYDLFHYNHLEQLKQSAKKCDFLIVGVESDEAIRIYKSPMRPIIPEKQRLEILNSINWVDAAFVKRSQFLEEDMRRALYKEISPDFISYGDNFGGKKWVDSACSEMGIGILRIETPNYPQSTSAIIRKVRGTHGLQ